MARSQGDRDEPNEAKSGLVGCCYYGHRHGDGGGHVERAEGDVDLMKDR